MVSGVASWTVQLSQVWLCFPAEASGNPRLPRSHADTFPGPGSRGPGSLPPSRLRPLGASRCTLVLRILRRRGGGGPRWGWTGSVRVGGDKGPPVEFLVEGGGQEGHRYAHPRGQACTSAGGRDQGEPAGGRPGSRRWLMEQGRGSGKQVPRGRRRKPQELQHGLARTLTRR